MIPIARISYTNTQPFFHSWDNDEFPLYSGVPRGLARAARERDVSAGPLPIVECWALEKQFMSLGNWGIAATERCRSVFVFSNKPFSQLDNVTIGVTRESSTSVALCSVLIQERYGNTAQLRRGLESDDDAWLVIGDQALKMGYSPATLARWTHVTDLASEWWAWRKLPFVFAQWVVRNDVDPILRSKLNKYVQLAYHQGLVKLDEIAEKESLRLQLQPELIKEYLKGFMYELNDDAIHSMHVFRELASTAGPELTAGRR